VRELYAELPLSRLRGWDAERFSFNTGEGRCRACDGQGAIEVEMDFLSDVWIPCTECRGLRFDRETLGARFKGLSVGDLLRLEVDAAIDFFANQPRALAIVETLQAVGLGYLKLGQAANTLSGGEAQRLKLARELAGGGDGGGTLYILDEPTTGLHFEDVRKLLEVLRALVLRGNTMVAIEHHLDVIGSADWVIDLGPEAGADGGRIVAAGAPEDIEASAASHTGRCLRQGHSLPSRRELPVP
jgi:excinuclease ABC subunit A